MKTYLQKHDKIKYTDNWSTPDEIYNRYVKQFGYTDPCPLNSEFIIDLEKHLVPYPMFINPPYSDISKWVEWAIKNHKHFGYNIILLIPSRTDTKYFHELLEYGVELEFIKGRLKFGNSKYGAPFPSVLVHLRGGSCTS